jgi:hypothetical protein
MINLGFGIDPQSNVFLDGNRVYRNIRGSDAITVSEFLKKTDNGSRLKSNFIYSLVNNLNIDKNSISVEHKFIESISYPYEWTPSMLKEAALYYLDLLQNLNEIGYSLKDGHPWNILFENGKPIWVDLGSVTEFDYSKQSRVLSGDFLNYFINTLLLFQNGNTTFARFGLSVLHGVEHFEFLDNIKKSILTEFKNSIKSGFKCAFLKLKAYQKYFSLGMHPMHHKSNFQSSINNIRDYISSINVTPCKGIWSNYYCGDNSLPYFDPLISNADTYEESTLKHKVICDILSDHTNLKILDIGCNTGLYSVIAEKYGHYVTSVDSDEFATDCLYKAVLFNNKKISVICQDFITPLQPTENYLRKRLIPLHTRCKSDIVMCLAVIHHWVFKKYKLTFDEISNLFSDLSQKIVIVEFVDPNDKNVSRWLINNNIEWYNLDNFVESLSGKFRSVAVLDSYPEHRKILICEK